MVAPPVGERAAPENTALPASAPNQASTFGAAAEIWAVRLAEKFVNPLSPTARRRACPLWLLAIRKYLPPRPKLPPVDVRLPKTTPSPVP